MEQSKQRWLELGCPLTMEEDLVAIRKDIEHGVLPKKERRVLYVAAYNEMRRHQGKKEDRKMDCASCNNELARQMKIWLGRYDRRSADQQERAKTYIKIYASTSSDRSRKNKSAVIKSKAVPNLPSLDGVQDLKSVDSRRAMYEQMEWNEIVKLMKTLPQESQEKLNKEKTRNYPKKSAIIEELLNVKPE